MLKLPLTQVDSVAADEGIAGDKVHIRPAFESGQFGVAFYIGRTSCLGKKAFYGFEPAFLSPTGKAESTMAIEEEITIYKVFGLILWN